MEPFLNSASWADGDDGRTLADFSRWEQALQPDELSAIDERTLDWLWAQFERSSGGTMDPDLEERVKELIGGFALIGDVAESRGAKIVATCVRRREHVVAQDRHPDGSLKARLLVDRVDNVWREHQQLADVESADARQGLRLSVSTVLSDCSAFLSTATDVAARRMVIASVAWCHFVLDDFVPAIEMTNLFLALAEEASTSSEFLSIGELVPVARAGAGSYVARGDLVKAVDVLRRLSALARAMPSPTLLVVARACLDAIGELDPTFARITAEQMLAAVRREHGDNSDDAVYAAYTVVITLYHARDAPATRRLLDKWLPIALARQSDATRPWLEFLPDAA